MSVGTYVRACVHLSVQCIVKNGGSDLDAVWHRRSDSSRDAAGSGVGIGLQEGVLFGDEFGAQHCNHCNFTAYVCDSAAMRPSSQITFMWALRRYVFY